MVDVLLADLDAKVTKMTTTAASAGALIRGIKAAQQAAIDAAMANGATAAQLAPVQALNNALGVSEADLAQAIVDNTSGGPVVPPPTPAPPSV